MKKVLSFFLAAAMLISLGICAFGEAGIIYCWNCGEKIPENSNFCPYCGSTQNRTPAKPAQSSLSFSVGDSIFFGRYEQDNVLFNGEEAIEWYVLDVDKTNSRMLLISKYGLDNVKYNDKEASVNWDICTLRTWLNSTFINKAFSYEEQACIADSFVSAQSNPNYKGKDAGKDTTDKIFILSAAEADAYLKSDDTRICAATPYAEAQGVTNYYDLNGACWYWMRNFGIHHNWAMHAYVSGEWNYDGCAVNRYDVAVRPALWIYY